MLVIDLKVEKVSFADDPDYSARFFNKNVVEKAKKSLSFVLLKKINTYIAVGAFWN